MANWIAKATENKGGLHKSLGVPAGKKLTAKQEAPKPGDSTKVKKEKALARTLKGFRK
jgi:hypothetical protein